MFLLVWGSFNQNQQAGVGFRVCVCVCVRERGVLTIVLVEQCMTCGE